MKVSPFYFSDNFILYVYTIIYTIIYTILYSILFYSGNTAYVIVSLGDLAMAAPLSFAL